MDPKQTPPGGTNSTNASASATGINSASASVSATGASVFANPRNRFNPNTATSNVANAGSTNPQGDILLPSSTSAKKSASAKNPLSGLKLSKPLILVIIAAVAIVVMLILTALLGSGSGGVFGGGEISDADLKTAFNRYANYAISGTDSTEDLTGEYEPNTAYAITAAVANHDTEYFDTAKTYFDNFYDLYEESLENIRETEDAENEDDDEGVGDSAYSYITTTAYQTIEEYKNVFNFTDSYLAADDLNEEVLLSDFISSSKDGAYNHIEENYAGLLDESYEIGVTYIEAKIAYDKALVDAFAIYASEGCIINGRADEACVDGIDYNKYDTSEIISASNSEDLYLDGSIFGFLASGCWDISSYLSGNTSESESEIEDGGGSDAVPSNEEDANL